MKLPLISIVIVNWNGLKWLKKCLDSLLQQTYICYEIVIVDNASTDDSVIFIRNNYPSVRIIDSKVNLGFSGGNNLGVDQARGELILLLNNDTWAEPDFLQKIFDGYHTKGCDVISTLEKTYDGTSYHFDFHTVDLLGHPVFSFYNNTKSKNSFYFPGSCLFFSKKLFIESGRLDKDFFMYCEDVDWFWRLHLLDKKICALDNIYVYHAGTGSTSAGIQYKLFLWRNQNTLQMLLKNYSLHNLLWILTVYAFFNLLECIFFLVLLKPIISLSYIEGWWFNIINIGKTFKKRKWIQKNRKVNDYEIMKNMYHGIGKLRHLINYFGMQRHST